MNLITDNGAAATVAGATLMLVTAGAVPGPGVTNVAVDVPAATKGFISNSVVELLNTLHRILAYSPSL
jgi:hypothetical protein